MQLYERPSLTRNIVPQQLRGLLGHKNFVPQYDKSPSKQRYIFSNYSESLNALGVPLPPYKAPPGYVWQYEVDGLSGLGKFSLKKAFKSVTKIATAPFKAIVKVSKKAVNIVKKVAKTKWGKALIVGAVAWYAGPAIWKSISSSKWFAGLASKVGGTAATQIVMSKLNAQNLPPDPSQAEMNEAIMKAQFDSENEVAKQKSNSTSGGGSTIPGWIIPAGIGAAALLLLTKTS